MKLLWLLNLPQPVARSVPYKQLSHIWWLLHWEQESCKSLAHAWSREPLAAAAIPWPGPFKACLMQLVITLQFVSNWKQKSFTNPATSHAGCSPFSPGPSRQSDAGNHGQTLNFLNAITSRILETVQAGSRKWKWLSVAKPHNDTENKEWRRERFALSTVQVQLHSQTSSYWGFVFSKGKVKGPSKNENKTTSEEYRTHLLNMRSTQSFTFLQQKREGKQGSCQSLNWAGLGVLEAHFS